MTERLETIFARKRELETRAKLLREVEAMKSAKLSADIVDLTKLLDIPEPPASLMDGGEML